MSVPTRIMLEITRRRGGYSAGSRAPSPQAELQQAISAWPIDTSCTPGTARREVAGCRGSGRGRRSGPAGGAACAMRVKPASTCACAACRGRARRPRWQSSTRSAPASRAAHLRRARIHEQADAQAHRLALGHQRREARVIVGKAPAVVGGGLVDAVGHEGHTVHRRAARGEIAHSPSGCGRLPRCCIRPAAGLQQLGELDHVDAAGCGAGRAAGAR